MSSLKNKLKRMKGHMNLEPQSENAEPAVEDDQKTDAIPFYEKWEKEGVSAYWMDGQYCLIRETRRPLASFHGNLQFAELKEVMQLWNRSALQHPLSASGLAIEDLFFFDTETTGLGGGAGNTIFLLGYAFIQDGEVIVRQHILPRPGSEIPLYQSFLEKINYETLVTYNGKAFDWPQLKTRHTLVKNHVPKLPEFGHFDLYHASRRLWKNRLEKVKLSAVETDILGFTREDDIPGYLAPMIYFDFVERQDPEILFGVLKHNELDVLSLITLYIYLSRQVLQADGYGNESLEVARWLKYLGETGQALSTYQQVIQEGNETEKITALHAVAFQKKREKDYNTALKIWERVAEEGSDRERKEAALECAKLLEHQFKKYDQAAVYTEKIYGMIEAQGIQKGKLEELRARLLRLKKKQIRQYHKKI